MGRNDIDIRKDNGGKKKGHPKNSLRWSEAEPQA